MSVEQHVTELTAPYALGALLPDEMRGVETHCAACASCAADLAEMRGLAATLPLACEQVSPSAQLKRRILSIARGDASAGEFLRNPSRRSLVPARTWWAAAAAAVFVVGAASGISAMLDHQRMVAQMDAMHRELALNQGAIAEIASAQRVWDLSGGTRDHWWHCTIVQPAQQKPAMLVAAMPPAPRGMAFQAWVIHRGSVHNVGMVPAGTTSMMHFPMPVQRGDVVAFSVEPMGGSATPTMPFAMQQTLD
jgi:anti-sigma-K factor RskA